MVAADIFDRYAEVGLVRRSFYERVHTCPKCDSPTVIFREVCVSCGMAGLERPELIHHFTCAGVFEAEAFGEPGNQTCPKCRLDLRFIGVDHEYLLGEFNCVSCGNVSSTVPTAGRCLDCEDRFPAERAGARDWYRFEPEGEVDPTEYAPKPMENALIALAGVAEERNHYIGSHVHRMRRYCALLSHTLKEKGYKETGVDVSPEWCDDLGDAALMHDIGNVALPESLICKRGVYTEDERAAVTHHVEYGSLWIDEMTHQFGQTNVLRMAQRVVRFHHEQWDGSGYGSGLIGKDAPLEARIVKVADVYDAMRCPRGYREGWPHHKAMEAIKVQANRTLDPDIVDVMNEQQMEMKAIFEQTT